MTSPVDLGGDPPCWSHLLDPPERDLCDRTDVAHLVRSFYRRAATDDVLGPVFTAAGVDWPAHIAQLVDFWSWQLFDGTSGAGESAVEVIRSRPPRAGWDPAHRL